ncbi:MAG: hypothetical protein EA397_16855 [Deltaproteobacteria bacterium]|nr:MAG: hypothetical protein EA397_16855 [Deltaproteobacteria bacterium]
MAARIIKVGEPAHANEQAAIEHLASELPSSVTVFANPWLIEPNGAVYELDAVVVMPHAIYVVEIKGWRGTIITGDHDWYLPAPQRSPLHLARKTAQILNNLLRRKDATAGAVWVQELVYLAAASRVELHGDAAKRRVATRQTIHAILHDEQRIRSLSRRMRLTMVDADVESALVKVLDSKPPRPPQRTILGFEVIDTVDTNERYREVIARHPDTDETQLLRIYPTPWQASAKEQERQHARAVWEAKVLRGLNHAPVGVGLLKVESPRTTEEGVVVPFEYFEGETLPSWIATRREQLSLEDRVRLWVRIARTVSFAHSGGVVHRHLRADLVLVRDKNIDQEPYSQDHVDFRVTGFDLAKRVGTSATIARSSVELRDLEGAAPEVINQFSTAEPRSDQFSLGLLLAWMVLGEPLVPSTVELVERRHRVPRLRDRDPDQKKRLDTAVATMLNLRPADRFATVDEAVEAVEAAVLEAEPRPAPEGLEPGARVGPDYVIKGLLGTGGLSEVYHARHDLRGEHFALKVARPTETAERALQREWKVLCALDHPAIVRVRDLSKMVDNRLTLVLDRVAGPTLANWVSSNPTADFGLRRKLAEGLLSALDEFERLGITHNDLKPENMIVGPDGLVLIDFSLGSSAELLRTEGKVFGGTHEWRDPALPPGEHGSDRFSAAMCLFWLHAGRHPFDGTAPEPGVAAEFEPSEFDPPGLATFFTRALHPEPAGRFPTARAMRDAYLTALGEQGEPVEVPSAPLESATALGQAGLSPRAVRVLHKNGIRTVGEILGLTEVQIRAINGLGSKTADQVLELVRRAEAAKVQPTFSEDRQAPPFFRPLIDSAARLYELPCEDTIKEQLLGRGLRTIGEVARTPRAALIAIPGIGTTSLIRLGEALVRYHDEHAARTDFNTLDGLWHQAVREIDDTSAKVLEKVLGLYEPARSGSEVGQELGLDPSAVSQRKQAALKQLNRSALEPGFGALDGYLELAYGVLPVAMAADRLARDLPANGISAESFVRLACEVDTRRFQILHDIDGIEQPVLLRPDLNFTRETLGEFARAVARMADQWPPSAPEPTRKALQFILPDYLGDPRTLAARLVEGVISVRGGSLARAPFDLPKVVPWLLTDARDEISIADLEALGDRILHGHFPPLIDDQAIEEAIAGTTWRFEPDKQLLVRGAKPRFQTPEPVIPDEIPELLREERRTPEEVARDVLRDAVKRSSYRLIVADPGQVGPIAKSVIRALDATPIDLADAWFQRHAATVKVDAHAERFPAMKAVLAQKAHKLFEELVAEHGERGRAIVVYNTGLLDAIGGVVQVRNLYERVQGGQHGFWVLVVPGVISGRTPLFNERTQLWHQPGLTLPLRKPLPDVVPPSA